MGGVSARLEPVWHCVRLALSSLLPGIASLWHSLFLLNRKVHFSSFTPMKPLTRLAHAVSWILHPFLLPLYMIGLLLVATPFARFSGGLRFYFVWVVALYAVVIPVLSLGLLRSLGRISDYRIDERRERIWPLVIGAVCYALCAVTFSKIPQAIFLRKIVLAAACCETMCLVVSLRWKISLHMTGMGAVVAMLVVMNIVGAAHLLPPLVFAVLAAGALASARLHLGCHNGRQVLAGFCGGFCVTVAVLLFL